MDNSYPRQLIPRTTRTQDNPYPGQLVPKTTRTQDNSYPWQLVPKTTRTQDNSYPRQFLPKTTCTQDNSYPRQLVPKTTADGLATQWIRAITLFGYYITSIFYVYSIIISQRRQEGQNSKQCIWTIFSWVETTFDTGNPTQTCLLSVRFAQRHCFAFLTNEPGWIDDKLQ